MKVAKNLLVILLHLILSVPVFAKGSQGGHSSSSHSRNSDGSKKSHAADSHDGHYAGGHGPVAQGRPLQEQEHWRSLSGREALKQTTWIENGFQ